MKNCFLPQYKSYRRRSSKRENKNSTHEIFVSNDLTMVAAVIRNSIPLDHLGGWQ